MITLRTGASILIASLIAITVSGCGAIGDTIHNERSAEFASVADLADEWDKTAPWVPGDATDILIRESTIGDPAVLRARSAAELDPELCVITERQSAPTFTDTWTPDAYVDEIWACGDWAVIPVEDGWFGWTPLDPDEKAAAGAAEMTPSDTAVTFTPAQATSE